MASALEKFVEAMNRTSLYWDKKIEVTAKHGEVVCIKMDGFTFMSDKEKDDVK